MPKGATRDDWTQFIRKHLHSGWNPSKKAGVKQHLCSGHFVADDFITTGKHKHLKDGVVPHVTYFSTRKENSVVIKRRIYLYDCFYNNNELFSLGHSYKKLACLPSARAAQGRKTEN